jgi:hypothetical protein
MVDIIYNIYIWLASCKLIYIDVENPMKIHLISRSLSCSMAFIVAKNPGITGAPPGADQPRLSEHSPGLEQSGPLRSLRAGH